MSGHSKWNNIKHKKEKTDAQKAKVFTKIGKEIAVVVKAGGPNPEANSKLKDLIAKAKAANVPNDNIERIIKKASSSDADTYETIYYEGYGPQGIAIIIEATTDNRNRTAGDVRHSFDKYGGNMGAMGCVDFMFEDKGVIVLLKDDNEVDEDTMMEAALECGAADFQTEDDAFIVYTEIDDLYDVKDAIEKAGYKVESADEDKIPTTYVTLTNEDDIKNMSAMLEKLDDNEDITRVYHNWENCDD